MPDKAKLIVKAGDKINKTFDLTKEISIIGRDPMSDIVIDDAEVSRKHLLIRKKNDTFFVEDQNSTNGSFLNGKRVRKSKEIRNGDLITIGENNVLEFILEQTEVKAEPIKNIVKGEDKETPSIDDSQLLIEQEGAKQEKAAVKREKKITAATEAQKENAAIGKRPDWKMILLIIMIFFTIFCIIPFVFIEVTNQWCNLFAGFFNSLSPNVCP